MVRFEDPPEHPGPGTGAPDRTAICTRNMHKLGRNTCAKSARKGANKGLIRAYFAYFYIVLETSRAYFYGRMTTCKAAFPQIGVQTASLSASRPTNLSAHRPTFNFQLTTVHCPLTTDL
jgi:hypothetical protein